MADQSPKYTINYILVGVLVVAAFLIGSLYTKVTILEKGTSTAQPTGAQAAVKYKTFDEALADFAKQAGMDGNKLVTCTNSGNKKSVVDAQVKEGEGVGVSGTPGFFVNGRFLGGAFPYESFKEVIDKELAGTGSDKVTDYSQNLQDANKSGAFDPKPRDVAVGTSSVRGKTGASVTVIEFSDFQCPFCSRVNPTVKKVLSDYGDKITFVYKHFPLVSIHPRAQKAAEASECAKDQGKFWEFHDHLFDN